MLRPENLIDILTILIASFSTLFALLFSFIFPQFQILFLTILTILLALIYQIGNIISKESVRGEAKKDLNILEGAIEVLERENKILKKNKK